MFAIIYLLLKSTLNCKFRYNVQYRDLRNCNGANNGARTLVESILVPEVVRAVLDWKNNSGCDDAILIGGLALAYYTKPRYTTDADFLFLSAAQIPNEVCGFKRHRKLAFEHKETGVEIEVLTPRSINMPVEVAQAINNTAVEKDGLKIASREGLIAAKLLRYSLQDRADIEELLKLGPVQMELFHLPQFAQENLNRSTKDK